MSTVTSRVTVSLVIATTLTFVNANGPRVAAPRETGLTSACEAEDSVDAVRANNSGSATSMSSDDRDIPAKFVVA